jgi:uncharacterized protein YndB with AHSA1/START domain
MSQKKNETRLTAEPGQTSIVISREFDATCDLVFRAHSDPKLFTRWYGCKGMKTTAIEFDCRTGGSYQLLQTVEGMGEFTVRGVYHEVRESELIVRTFESGPNPGRVALEVMRFEALPGDRTRVIGETYLQSVADRDALLKMGVEYGTREAHEQLRALLEELARS